MSDGPPPKVSVSYSWENDEHQSWVESLAKNLTNDGVYVSLDRWDMELGRALTEYMEALVRDHERVLVVCTPTYKEKSERREGGVGYEGSLMTAELLKDSTQRKFIPVLRLGDWDSALPSWLAGRLGADLRDEDDDTEYRKLLDTLHGRPPKRPPVGTRYGSSGLTVEPPVPVQARSDEEPEPIRITGIVDEGITSPRDDGSRGSALYAVPFRLSRKPSSLWAQRFPENWNHPPIFTTMHRPGIARVSRDRIILDGTTIEEVERYHLKTLKLAIEKTNEEVEAVERRERAEAEQRERQEHERRENISDVSRRLDFD